MEYLDGTDLEVPPYTERPAPGRARGRLSSCKPAKAIASEAHVGGIVHRDLKPATSFSRIARGTASRAVKVLDFDLQAPPVAPYRDRLLSRDVAAAHQGLAALHVARADAFGQERGPALGISGRSGAIFSSSSRGKPPFQGDSITALCAAILMAPPPPLSSRHGDVLPALAAVVAMLEKDPANRFANIAELASALAPLRSLAARASPRHASSAWSRGLRTRLEASDRASASLRRTPRPRRLPAVRGASPGGSSGWLLSSRFCSLRSRASAWGVARSHRAERP